eukprot:TRINITY_DN11729_c0_g1_i1.p1 TRINITY_DN11729_c0_g1~~TRINITY_DN11729_c0_g1_i1.p1  ORF type:complete len:250 (+),score=37.43 TRINITY_DN11729_c0_g1_i1:73-822(+)
MTPPRLLPAASSCRGGSAALSDSVEQSEAAALAEEDERRVHDADAAALWSDFEDIAEEDLREWCLDFAAQARDRRVAGEALSPTSAAWLSEHGIDLSETKPEVSSILSCSTRCDSICSLPSSLEDDDVSRRTVVLMYTDRSQDCLDSRKTSCSSSFLIRGSRETAWSSSGGIALAKREGPEASAASEEDGSEGAPGKATRSYPTISHSACRSTRDATATLACRQNWMLSVIVAVRRTLNRLLSRLRCIA